MPKRTQWRAAVVAVFLAALFSWLAEAVMHGTTEGFDRSVRDTVHVWASPQLTFAMRGLTQLGSPTFLVALGVILGWRLGMAGRRREAVLLVIAAIGGEALDEGLKLLFERHRPEAYFGLAEPLGYSFPSGHSMASCCFYGGLALIATGRGRSRGMRWGIYAGAAVVIGAIGLSRVYLGVHYPTDVLGGYTAAVAWLVLVWAYGREATAAVAAGSPPDQDGAPRDIM